MAYIYMDESGDLTFNSNYWSNFFVITFLITQKDKDMKVVMKNLHKWMKGKWLKMKWTFFHTTKEETNTVKRILDLVSRRDIKIVSMILDKNLIPYELTTDSHKLYNSITWKLLKQCEKRGFLRWWTKHYFIASRKETNQFLKQNLWRELLTSAKNGAVLVWSFKWFYINLHRI